MVYLPGHTHHLASVRGDVMVAQVSSPVLRPMYKGKQLKVLQSRFVLVNPFSVLRFFGSRKPAIQATTTNYLITLINKGVPLEISADEALVLDNFRGFITCRTFPIARTLPFVWNPRTLAGWCVGVRSNEHM